MVSPLLLGLQGLPLLLPLLLLLLELLPLVLESLPLCLGLGGLGLQAVVVGCDRTALRQLLLSLGQGYHQYLNISLIVATALSRLLHQAIVLAQL